MRYLIFLFVLGIVACTNIYSIENSQNIAENFIVNSPTYKFDGSNLKLVDSNTLRCENCYIYVYEFTSSHAGFGDRQDQVLAEVVTNHLIDVIVQKGTVIQAIIDNEWNEIKQRKIQNYEIIDGEKIDKIPIYYCIEPRPQDCEAETDRVCGSNRIDYQSPCKACSNSGVKWYTKGDCTLGYADKAVADLSKGKITKESSTLLILIGWSN